MEGYAIWDEYPDEEDWEPDDYDEAYENWHERFIDLYWDDAHTLGGICISHRGCALRNWLVVSGPARGQVWSDDRVDEGGLSPLLKPDGSPMTLAIGCTAGSSSPSSRPQERRSTGCESFEQMVCSFCGR